MDPGRITPARSTGEPVPAAGQKRSITATAPGLITARRHTGALASAAGRKLAATAMAAGRTTARRYTGAPAHPAAAPRPAAIAIVRGRITAPRSMFAIVPAVTVRSRGIIAMARPATIHRHTIGKNASRALRQ